jgi:hypothetical protein
MNRRFYEIDADEKTIERAIGFCSNALGHYSSYHDHKESMAYAGAGLQIALFGYIMMAEQWPPCWLNSVVISHIEIPPKCLTFGIVTLLWLLIHIYIRWQLRKRRMAAIEVAGTLRTLAKWIATPPSFAELSIREYNRPENCLEKLLNGLLWLLKEFFHLLDFFIPIPFLRVGSDTEYGYPQSLQNNIKEQWKNGTGAIQHEELHCVMSILLWLCIFFRTLCR